MGTGSLSSTGDDDDSGKECAGFFLATVGGRPRRMDGQRERQFISSGHKEGTGDAIVVVYKTAKSCCRRRSDDNNVTKRDIITTNVARTEIKPEPEPPCDDNLAQKKTNVFLFGRLSRRSNQSFPFDCHFIVERRRPRETWRERMFFFVIIRPEPGKEGHR
jgi:hypothetical protein